MRVTTGASNDIERATMLARNMVTKWGLSDKLGPLTYSEESGEVFLGRQVTQHKQVSDETAHVIDVEVRRVIDTAYQQGAEHPRDAIATSSTRWRNALIKYETIDEQPDQGHHGRAARRSRRPTGTIRWALRRRSVRKAKPKAAPDRLTRRPALTS